MFRIHQVYQPHPALRHLVNNITIQKVDLDPALPLPVFPLPPIQEQAIFFYPQDPVYMGAPALARMVKLPQSVIVARRMEGLHVQMGYHHMIVKVGFQPGGLFRFLGCPISEFGTDAVLNATDDLLGRDTSLLVEQLTLAASSDDIRTIIEKWLFQKLHKVKAELPIDKALPTIIKTGRLANVSEIAAHACVSIRQLERLYQQRIGLPPQYYARLVRFTKAWIIKEANPALPWTKLAYDCGYFDQMHLVRDFKQFTGVTPSFVQRSLDKLPCSLQHEVFL